MRNLKRVSLVSLVSVALLGTMALPATAADTVATVAVAEGTIGITAPLNSTATGTGAEGKISPDTVATTSLEAIKVTDLRAGTAGWTASVHLSAFTATIGAGSEDLQFESAVYNSTDLVPTGNPTVTPVVDAELATSTAVSPVAVQTATGVSGNNTATWNATIAVAIPAQALAGNYTATLTHSVL